jgi:hypothetical protein
MGSRFRGEIWRRTGAGPIDNRPAGCQPAHKDDLFLKMGLSQVFSMTYGHRLGNRRNSPFNTRTCHTTKEINSLMAAGGLG